MLGDQSRLSIFSVKFKAVHIENSVIIWLAVDKLL